ncbi:hypothetical protein EVAR_91714_1 [Eumeta japonica]|uniref:Uncharacterized protein n=1 Tax=Eumeta variegata TaxID=151549 RepID=A0A4C1ZBM3_EUMVA|nr:hypothetical protein EVAR_91714_1 [Eumeta japonica]
MVMISVQVRSISEVALIGCRLALRWRAERVRAERALVHRKRFHAQGEVKGNFKIIARRNVRSGAAEWRVTLTIGEAAHVHHALAASPSPAARPAVTSGAGRPSAAAVNA